MAATLAQVERLGGAPRQVFVDRGYRGHDYEGPIQVHVDRTRRGKLAVRLWRWMKRRAAIEPGIGHLKQEHRMDRCRLWGVEGDQFNATLSAAGMNFRKLLARAAVSYCLLLGLLQIMSRKRNSALAPASGDFIMAA